MRLSKLIMLLLGALALAACAPGGSHAGTNPTAKPTSLQIKDYEVTQPAPTTLLIEDAAAVQNIYTSAVALPVAPSEQACPAVGGPRYDLTFLQGEQVVATAVADSGGCGTVTFGANDVRQANEAFWQLLRRTIARAMPPLQPDKAEVVSFTGPQVPPLLSTIASADQARQLYNALHALPALPESTACPQLTGSYYTLVFFEAGKLSQAMLDKNGCISGPAEYEHHQADEAFWQLLKQTLASAPTEKARPDTLNMKMVPASNDPSTTASDAAITDQTKIQNIYAAIYALPEQSGGQTCSSSTGTIYGLIFSDSKDGVELLSVVADKGCGTVTDGDGFVRVANQAFWDLLRQAQAA
jgi:hypothetical protein